MTLPILLILGALCAFGPMAIDFYLPAFPALAKAFATTIEQVQWSLAAYFVGVALGQLIYGPLADRFGRRPPLLAGILLFTVASLACALATDLLTFVALRFVQALGGCAGMVIAHAVVRDLWTPLESARVFSRLMLVMGLAPILAPLGGGLLLAAYGWQSIFIGLTLFGGLCLLAALQYLPETRPGEASGLPLRGSLARYRVLFGDITLIGNGLTGGIAMAGMFAYIVGSPFVFIDLYGFSPTQYAWLFGTNAAGFILTAQLNGWLLRWQGPAYWLRQTVRLYAIAALCLLAVALSRPASPWPLLPPLFIVIASLSCILPNSTACAMAGQGQQAGSASALIGALQFAIAAISSALVGLLHDGSARPMALTIALCGLGSVLLTWLTSRRA